MSHKQNDILVDNLTDRMVNLDIYDLLVGNEKGFKLSDFEEIEHYINIFESMKPTDENYFECLTKLKYIIKSDKNTYFVRNVIKPILNKIY